jgi:hypothetical protein
VPGELYAVRIATESSSRTFQARWGSDDNPRTQCLRRGPEGRTTAADQDLWLAVAGDGDGLVIPYNKRVHKEFAARGRFASRWAQTWRPRGRSLASVVLYASGSTDQISINRQRLAVRVREGGHDGPVVGTAKIASGNGDYTGDASWGVFGAAWAPGEVALEPGRLYAIEFESFENFNTLHGYINIKNVPSRETGGFTPFVKAPPDQYAEGAAWIEGREEADLDLDMQIVEYEHAALNWASVVESQELLVNGDMQSGALDAEAPERGRPDGWRAFAIDPGTTHHYIADDEHPANRMLRVIGGCWNGKTVDGGYVQRVAGLDADETYRLSGRLRSSWAVDEKHQCFIGYDPTGQDEDPRAATIQWTTLPGVHGVFVPYRSDPVRPAAGQISVWLRARTTSVAATPIKLKLDPMIFRVEFDDFSLRQVSTGVPQADGGGRL